MSTPSVDDPLGDDLADARLRDRAPTGRGRRLSTDRVIRLDVGARPHSVAMTPDDTTLYVSEFGAGAVAVVDVATGSITRSLEGFDHPYGVALSGNGRGLHVVSPSSEQLDFVDLDDANPSGGGGAHIGRAPYGVAATPRGDVLYLSLALEDSILITDRFGKGENTTIGGVEFPVGVALSPSLDRLYVANYFSSTVTVVDLPNRTRLRTIPVDPDPYGVAASADGRHVFVSHFLGGLVTMIDTGTGTVAATLSAGEGPRGVAVSHDGAQLFLTNFFADSVSVVDVAQFHER